MGLTNEDQLTLIKRLKAIAETGLVYAESDYSEERYTEIRQISLQLLSHLSNSEFSVLDNFFLPEKDYPTVKVDVRAFVLNDKKQVLLAKERIDGKWTIPGGWADIGDTPSEAVLKEIKEETGLDAEVKRLLAVYDKRCHPHPPQPFYIYKLIFYCEVKGGHLNHGFDMHGADYFDVDKLPELSEDRILKSQIEHLLELTNNGSNQVYFD